MAPLTKFAAMGEEVYVGRRDEFVDGLRRIVEIGDRSVGVFARAGEFYAYLNRCPHQGGPVCEGVIVAKAETEVNADGSGNRGRFSSTEKHLACPWHGVEFNLTDGICWSDPRLRLRPYEVVLRDDEVLIRV